MYAHRASVLPFIFFSICFSFEFTDQGAHKGRAQGHATVLQRRGRARGKLEAAEKLSSLQGSRGGGVRVPAHIKSTNSRMDLLLSVKEKKPLRRHLGGGGTLGEALTEAAASKHHS